MQFINKENDIACLGDFINHFFQSFFKFAAVFGTGNKGRHIKRDYSFATQSFWNMAIDNTLRKPFGNRCFADSRFTDKDRVIFCPAAQNLNDPLNFCFPANDGINFIFLR